MRRVSTGLANNDVQYNLRVQESKANKMNNQMGSQRRIQELRDDPLAAGHLVRYQSYLERVKRFEQNAKTLTDQYSVSEGYIRHSLEVMHRVRELAVTGANGVYTKDDLKNMASEVDELLKEYIEKFSKVKNKHFVTGHAAFGYLCRDFDLKQNSVTDIFNENEPNPKELAKLVEYCREHNVRVIFTEEAASPLVSKTLATELGAKVEKIYTIESPEDNKSYLERMKTNLMRIYENLK